MILSALLVRPYNPNRLALIPGTRLGVYDITAQIGVGGMGEVYQATDTNLKRQVAIKVLPAAVGGDAERLARFQREAEVLAALNHPNIAQIFGLEKTPDFTALVMELVEGDDLLQRIARGAIPLDEALPIAKQIAEAVEAAHEQGIIHRDLKPANIKVRPDGTVKVLDFGLAKAMEPAASSSPSMSMSPTITTPAMTQAGMILGTAAYMSPEQAKGRPADKRSDIWAFGCVLYEMLTGRRAFEGEDLADTLASVLKSTPNWAALPPSLPAGIRTLLMRCLDRDRAKRVADAATVRYVIAEVASLAPGVDADDVTPRVAQRTAVRPLLLAGALAALLAIGVAVAVWNLQPPAPLQNVTRFSIQVSDLTTVGRNQMAVSPDGTRLVYYRNGQPVLRDLSESDSRIISPDFGQSAFSPDGRSLAVYRFADRAIQRMGVMGGAAAVTVCPSDNVFGMTWDTTGIISGQGSKGILRCRLDGSAPEQLATVQEGEVADRPQILPGGDGLLFTIAKTADGATRWDNARIVVQSLKSGERTTLFEGGSAAQYVPSGHLLYARGGVVFAVPFDATTQKITGQAAAVIEGVRRVASAATGAAHFTVSDTGNLYYIPGPASTAIGERMVGLADRSGGVTRLEIPAGPYVRTRVSRDGARLAIESETGDQAAISIYALGGTSAPQRLTLEGRNRLPVWSPEGTRVAFQSDRGGDQAVFVQGIDGTGPAERLTKPANDESHVPESWSRDGRSILVSVVKGAQFSLSVLSLADRTLVPFGVTSTEPIGAVFSPDGRWVAYHRRRLPFGNTPSVEDGVFVQPFPATGAIYQAPRVGADFHPVWAPDGNALVYVESAASGNMVTVAVTAQAGVTFGAPASSPAAVTGDRISGETRAYDILPDGRFVGLVEVPDADGSRRNTVREIRVVLNWFEELKRLAPAN